MALDDTEMPVSVGWVVATSMETGKKSSTGSGTKTRFSGGKNRYYVNVLMDTDIRGREPLLKHTFGCTNATIY